MPASRGKAVAAPIAVSGEAGGSVLAARRIRRRSGGSRSGMMDPGHMLCAAIDIGSNTTRVLVAEPDGGQLRKVMEQRAYTRIGRDAKNDGNISEEKTAEVADVVATQVRLADELGAEAIRVVATAAIREAGNGEEVAGEIARVAGLPVEVLSDREEGRLAFIGATKTLGHPVEGDLGVVDVGGGSTEVILGSIADGVKDVHSFKIGSGMLAEEFLRSDPPGPAEIRALRDRISDFFDGVEIRQPDQAVAVGGSATSLRRLVGAVLEYETLERGVRVLTGDTAEAVAKKFELDSRRVEILPSGILLLEQISQMLGQPLQIGKGGLREGIILDRLHENGKAGGKEGSLAA
jgi:exopolyphosphatase / guanosine-5'-triphosphate,3'-diphosphate pyrophosphatase